MSVAVSVVPVDEVGPLSSTDSFFGSAASDSGKDCREVDVYGSDSDPAESVVRS